MFGVIVWMLMFVSDDGTLSDWVADYPTKAECEKMIVYHEYCTAGEDDGKTIMLTIDSLDIRKAMGKD